MGPNPHPTPQKRPGPFPAPGGTVWQTDHRDSKPPRLSNFHVRAKKRRFIRYLQRFPQFCMFFLFFIWSHIWQVTRPLVVSPQMFDFPKPQITSNRSRNIGSGLYSGGFGLHPPRKVNATAASFSSNGQTATLIKTNPSLKVLGRAFLNITPFPA